jgi:hypothetical protein
MKRYVLGVLPLLAGCLGEFKPTAVAFGIYYQACTVVHGK